MSLQELQGLEQFIYADYSNFIHVENVYESVLLQILDKEVTTGTIKSSDQAKHKQNTQDESSNPFCVLCPAVVKEAANLKKHNLFTDNKDLVSQSSRSSLSSPSPSVSTPDSPAMSAASPVKSSFEPQPPSPLVANCLKRISQVKELPAAKEKDQTVKAEENAHVELETSALADTTTLSEMPVVNVAAAPETVVQEEVISVKTEKAETAAEPETQSTDALKEAEIVVSEVPTVTESIKTDAEEAQTDIPVPSPDTTNETVTTTTGSLQVASSEGETQCESSEVTLEAPPSGEGPALAPEDISLDTEPVTISDPNSLDVSVGSESPVSDLESIEEAKAMQSCEDQVSTASDVLEYEAHVSTSPMSLDGKATGGTPSPQPQVEAVSSDDGVSGGTEAGASVNLEGSVEATDTTTSQSSLPAKEEALSSTASPPPDCIKEIRDLVVEVIEVEEMVQHYPSGVPTEE